MSYRGVVKHVRYWRGAIHTWSTVYPFIGTLSSALAATDAQALLVADAKMCYGAAGTGGAYQCELYNTASGGVPVATYTAFDHTNPSAWPGAVGSVWTVSTAFNAVAEPALLVEWAAGTSSSGKPVKLRKWYHAVPISPAASGSAVDVPTAQATLLAAQATALEGVLGSKGLALGSPKGVFATGATVSSFYSNHQMPRGRRRKALVTAGGIYKGPAIQIPSGFSAD